MAMVRFATTCDSCGRRSEEYSKWCACRECLDDTCTDCDVPSQRNEETGKTLCQQCAEELDDEPECECFQVDVDLVDNRWCPAHGPGSPADRYNRQQKAEAEAKFWEGIKEF